MALFFWWATCFFFFFYFDSVVREQSQSLALSGTQLAKLAEGNLVCPRERDNSAKHLRSLAFFFPNNGPEVV